MGVTTLAALRDGLVAVGLPAGTPAALIERGGTDAPRVLRGTLNAVVAPAPAWHTRGPALLMTGDVAAGAEEEARLAP
jgi:uroporphyrin-III C-methyltransferase/precorrin-2 dehydrogenase/sirohydrochlorin ferrochelatase